MPLTSGKETSRRQVQSWWWAVSPVPRGKRTDLPRCWSHRYTMGTLGSFEVSPQAARESLSFFFDYLYTCYCPLNTPCSEGRLLFLHVYHLHISHYMLPVHSKGIGSFICELPCI